MPDLGRDIQFGYFLVPNAADPLMETALEVERLGLDYIAIQDHPYQRRYVDTWTLMAMIAAKTTTLKIFPDVANLPLRLPSMIAKGKGKMPGFEKSLGADKCKELVAFIRTLKK